MVVVGGGGGRERERWERGVVVVGVAAEWWERGRGAVVVAGVVVVVVVVECDGGGARRWVERIARRPWGESRVRGEVARPLLRLRRIGILVWRVELARHTRVSTKDATVTISARC